MEFEIPDSLIRLARFLEESCGLSHSSTKTSRSFGDTEILMDSPRFRVSLVRDRGQWSVYFAHADEPGEWYYVALLMELIQSPEAKDLLTVDEQANLLQNNWPELERLFSEDERQQTRAALRRLGEESRRRRLPGLFS